MVKKKYIPGLCTMYLDLLSNNLLIIFIKKFRNGYHIVIFEISAPLPPPKSTQIVSVHFSDKMKNIFCNMASYTYLFFLLYLLRYRYTEYTPQRVAGSLDKPKKG